MLIAQITDLHLGFPYDDLREVYAERLRRTVKRLCEMQPQPDLVLCTGDLTESGDLDSFKELRQALKPLPMPCYLCIGNHDLRGPMLEAFPETETANGFIQYAIDQGPLRILVLDTLEEGRHAGAYGPERQRWLKARLDEAPNRPTLIVLHHPPVVTGIEWMSLDPRESWARQLTAIIQGRKQIVGAIAGHVHRPIVCDWAGTSLRVCSSVAPQVTLDLAPIDSDHPDNRVLVHQEAPAYALHLWSPETGLVTHFGTVEAPPPTLRFQDWFQKTLRHFEAERTREPTYPGEGWGSVKPGVKALYSAVLIVAGAVFAAGLLLGLQMTYFAFVARGDLTIPLTELVLDVSAVILLGLALPALVGRWAFRRLFR
jgi:hypothetical protein